MSIHKLLDKIFLSPDAWWMRIIWTRWTRSITLWGLRLLPIKRGRCFFVSRAGANYSCNPRAIAEYIAKEETYSSIFDCWFGLDDPEKYHEIPKAIKPVKLSTLQHHYIFHTAQFLVSNQNWWIFEGKRDCQIYIQTMHGGHGIKKFGLDAEMYATPGKLHDAMLKDTARTDLALSDSEFFTTVIRRCLAFKCPILTEGLPRNDIFFTSDDNKKHVRESLLSKYKVPVSAKTLIYAPTFREPKTGILDLSVYWFDPDRIIASMKKRFGGDWYILVSSHPLMKGYYREIYDFSHPRVIDLGQLPDVQELLISGDVLITDYSSIEMDFSLTGRPVFQLARDWRDYDRGTYLDMHELPFPFAETEDELCASIEAFDLEKYQTELMMFNKIVIGLKESGHATETVVNWMKERVIL